MLVSVILCTYSSNKYQSFKEAADSVLSQSYPDVELVIVIDGPQLDRDQVESDFGNLSNVVIQQNDENRGLLASRNLGVERSNGDIVAFIDDDAVADEHWLEELVSTYESSGAISAGGRMAPDWVDGKPRYLPPEFYWLVGVTHKGFADGPGEVRNTFGSNLSFRRDVFQALGGFDSEIGGRKGDRNLQGGETELCARMQVEYGSGVMYNPDAVVYHKVFEYRTRPGWLLRRAFWQGYSKRAMSTLTPDSSGRETDFIRELIYRFGPDRLRSLIARPSSAKLMQFLVLWVLTATVGLGYLYGLWKW